MATLKQFAMEKPHLPQGSEALIQGVQLHQWSLVVECPVPNSKIAVQILTFGKPPHQHCCHIVQYP